MISNIWWARNSAIFKDKDVPPEVTRALTLSQAVEFREDLKGKEPRIPIPPSIDFEIPWGYFDRANQGHLLKCGVGVVLFLNQNHYIHI